MPALWSAWEPDRGPWNAPDSAVDTLNVLPYGDHYAPVPSFTAFSQALATQPYGATSFVASGTRNVTAGTLTKLWTLDGQAWTDDSKAGGYHLSSEEFWTFLPWGNLLFACNIADPLQYRDVTTTTDFADVAGSPPQAKFVFKASYCVALGNISGFENRIAHSDVENPGKWTGGYASYQDFPGSGPMMNGVGDENGAFVFWEKAIRRMEFTGAKPAFVFEDIETGLGCVAPHSIVRLGARVFFMSWDGPYELGQPSAPIGHGRVAKTFMADIADGQLKRIQGTADPVNQRVYWHYTSKAAPGTGSRSRVLAYSLREDRFTIIDWPGWWMLPASGASISMEDLALIYPNLDEVPFSLDSEALRASGLKMGGFDTDWKFGFFEGPPMAALLESGLGQLTGEGLRQYYDGGRPLVDTSTFEMRVGHCERPDAALVWTAWRGPNVTGAVPQRASGRFVRVQMRIPAATPWTRAQGLEDVRVVPAGER